MKRVISLWCPMAAVAALSLVSMPSRVVATPVADHLRGQLVDVRMRVDGNFSPLYARDWSWGSHRRYFEAIQGGRYAVELRNLTDRRIGVLMSVDGLNVVSGLRSALQPGEGMYVLDPFQSAEIRGWRTSLDDVRQFVFVDEQRSYAERTGQANGDMGWIRVVAFEELRPVALWGSGRTNYRGGAAAPNSAAPTPEVGDDRADGDRRAAKDVEGGRKLGAEEPRAQGLARNEASRERSDESFPGTGWGERREDHVNRIEFHAAATPTDQLVLRYEYAAGLRQLGIFPRHRRVWDREDGALGFAKPPRW